MRVRLGDFSWSVVRTFLVGVVASLPPSTLCLVVNSGLVCICSYWFFGFIDPNRRWRLLGFDRVTLDAIGRLILLLLLLFKGFLRCFIKNLTKLGCDRVLSSNFLNRF